jgi:hypothetical protein
MVNRAGMPALNRHAFITWRTKYEYFATMLVSTTRPQGLRSTLESEEP